MKTILHKAQTRGYANHGWLKSYHTFSFAGYNNPDRIHFGALRVLNDDTVSAGMGFGTHPHDNMEIISIPLSGDLHHKDSTGRDKIIKENDVQIMNAGSGISHSETNANRDREVKFLQIWVFPKNKNITPQYDQKSYLPEDRVNKIVTVVAPDQPDALWINQDAWFSMSKLTAGKSIDYSLHKQGNGIYLFIIKGEISTCGIDLKDRDALGITETDNINLLADTDADILIIEVPMEFKI